MANYYGIYRAAVEDLPATWATLKNDVEGTGIDVKISKLNRVGVSYCDNSSPKNVKFLYSENLGSTWTSPVTVETDVEDCQTGVAFDPLDRIYVFFVKDFSGTKRIAYRMSETAGTSWGDLKDTGLESDT